MIDLDKDLEKMINEEQELVDSSFDIDMFFFEEKSGPKKVGRPKKKESIDVPETMNFLSEAIKRLG